MDSLNVAVEDLGNLKRKITVTIPEDKVKEAYDKCYLSLKNKVSINGFRQGKVPQSFLEKRFTKAMKEEAIETLVPEFYEKALKQESLKPAGRPQFGDLEIDKKKPLIFSASFEVFADFNVPDTSVLKLEKKEIEFTDEEIKEQRQRHLDGAATFTPKIGEVGDGDQVKIDFVGKIEEETIAESKDHVYNIGSKHFLPEFETALLGMSEDEEKNFDLTFPSDYNEDTLRDKTAKFSVKVKEIKEKSNPELDEDFFKRYGERVKSVEDFDKIVEDEVKFRKENEIKNAQRTALREQLKDLLDFDVPEQLTHEETSVRINQAKRKKENEGVPDEELESKAKEDAIKDLRFSILVQKVLDEEELKPDEMEVHKRFEINCAMMGIRPEELMNQDYGRQIYQQIYGMAAEDTVLDFLIDKTLK